MKIYAALLSLLVALAVPFVAQAQNPYAKPNASWITLSGTVAAVAPDAFRLDYGEGLITVEMDDWDWYAEGTLLAEGDEVTVNGFVDDDLYELRSIEASSVYVNDLNTYFYASGADEEDWTTTASVFLFEPGQLQLTGTVTSVSGREFTLDTGTRQIQVDTITMPYNPLDDTGFQKIRKGDRVRVSGSLDFDLFEKREILADSIVTLLKDKTKKNGSTTG